MMSSRAAASVLQVALGPLLRLGENSEMKCIYFFLTAVNEGVLFAPVGPGVCLSLHAQSGE